MSAFQNILQECVGISVAMFVEGGMFLDGKVIEVTADTVTLQVNIQTERQAFSAGADLKRQTTVDATVLLEKIIRLDRIATKRP